MDCVEGVVFTEEHGGGVGAGAGFDKVCPFVAIRGSAEELVSGGEAGAAMGGDARGGRVGVKA